MPATNVQIVVFVLQDPLFGVGSDVLSPRKIGTHLAENIEFSRECLSTIQINNDNYLISGGNWENSFQVISLSDGGRIIQSIRQHKDVVSCVAGNFICNSISSVSGF
jgi:hypothetical protein